MFFEFYAVFTQVLIFKAFCFAPLDKTMVEGEEKHLYILKRNEAAFPFFVTCFFILLILPIYQIHLQECSRADVTKTRQEDALSHSVSPGYVGIWCCASYLLQKRSHTFIPFYSITFSHMPWKALEVNGNCYSQVVPQEGYSWS